MKGFFYFKLWSVAHKLADRNTGMMEQWNDAFKMQYSNIPMFQYSVLCTLIIELSTARRRGNSRVAGRGYIGGSQRLHESNESCDLLRRQILAKRGHVAAALKHLPDQLVAGQTSSHTIQCRAAQAALAAQAVAIPALLVLQYQRALQLQRRTAVHILHRCGNAAPGFHVGTPRGECPQVRQGTECQEHENPPQYGHGPPPGTLFPGVRNKRKRKEKPNPNHRRGQEQKRLDVWRPQWPRGINPEEKEIRGRRGVDVSRVRYSSRSLGTEIGGTGEYTQHH